MFQLSQQKAEEYIHRKDTVAVAITGTVARGSTWNGSDIDLWVFCEGEEDFEDGLIEGVYLEVDVKPAYLLEMNGLQAEWIKPLPLNQSSERFRIAMGMPNCIRSNR